MEVRCGQCNKLFRVSDDKITGAGIKFKCTKCGGDVRITAEEFQEYQLSKDAVSVLDTFAPKLAEKPSAQQPAAAEPEAAGAIPGFELLEEKEAPPVPELKVTATPSPPPAPPSSPPRTAPQQPTTKQEAAKAPQPRKPEPSPAPSAAPAAGPSPAMERPVAPLSPEFSAVTIDAVHPLVSGSLAGSVGGIGCAIPVLVMTLLGVGAVSMLAGGKTGNLPVGQVLLLTGSSFIGFGVLIGIVLAFFQARSESSMFGFLGILIGGFLGAIFGAVMGMIVAAGSGAVFSFAIIISSVIGWSIKALLLSGAVVLARRMMLSSRTESSAATISGGQLLGIGLAVLVLFLGMFGEVRSALSMKTVKEDAAKAFQDMASAEGLQVTSSLASWDPATGDLLLNVTLENTGDSEKKPWYLVADVYDASGNVLATVKMLTGKQLYTERDYGIMSKRGVNAQSFRFEQMKQPEAPIAAHAVINVEMRVMEPPAGVASFVASFQPFDPLKMLREQLEEAAKQKQGSTSQQSR